ncbi:unnamed protein product [Brassica oleracea var. botrytis]
MPLEWPLALFPHHRPSSSRSLFRMICALFSYPVLAVASLALASPNSVRRFSATTGEWWFHFLTLGLRSHPNITWVCLSSCGGVRDICVQVGLGVGSTEDAALFCSERHRVQAVFGINKCSVLVTVGVLGLC